MSIFAGWPPEVISAMIYSGPGSGPMMEAAAAWDSLAADLQSTATSFQSVVSGLTGAWQGPSATTMTGAAEPYLAWIQNTATQALQAGAQANMAGAAYDTAFASTVPPPAIAANRAQLMALIATNFFGQNTPAIAATEAEYAGMWAQDVAMMINYSLSSMQATVLQAFTGAPTVANAAMGTPAAATNSTGLGNSLASLVPNLLGQFATPTALAADPTGGTNLLSGLLGSLGLSGATDPSSALGGILGSLGNTLGLGSGSTGLGSLLGGSSSSTYALQAAYYGTMIGTTPARMFMGMGQSMANSSAGLMDSQGLLNSIGQFVDGKMQLVVGNVAGNVANQLRAWGSAVSAQLAHATTVGHLSVPQAWSMAAPAMNVTRAAPVLPATSVSAPSLTPPSAGMPGGPFGQALMGALSGRGLSTMGVKTPKVVPRSPAGG